MSPNNKAPEQPNQGGVWPEALEAAEDAENAQHEKPGAIIASVAATLKARADAVTDEKKPEPEAEAELPLTVEQLDRLGHQQNVR